MPTSHTDGLVAPINSTVLTANGVSGVTGSPGEHVFATWKNLSIAVWRSRATGDSVRKLAQIGKSIQRKYPQGRSTIHVVCDGAGAPTDEARDLFVGLMTEDQIACIGVVILGSGFWASALRSFLTGMVVDSESQLKTRHTDSVRAMMRWMPERHLARTGIAIDPERLEEVLNALVRG